MSASIGFRSWANLSRLDTGPIVPHNKSVRERVV